MSKKHSLAVALQTLERAPAAPPRAAREKQEGTSPPRAPSRTGKKALIAYFDPGVSKQLKQLALDRDTSAQELVREALNDFFHKHKKPAIA